MIFPPPQLFIKSPLYPKKKTTHTKKDLFLSQLLSVGFPDSLGLEIRAYLPNLHIPQGFITLPIWHFSPWSRVCTGLCPPQDCALKVKCFESSVHAAPLPQCSVNPRDGLVNFNLFLSLPEHMHLKVLFQFSNARNGLRINTRDYSTAWPGPTHTVGQLLHRTKGQVGTPSQPMFLLPSTLACRLCTQGLCQVRRKDSSAPRGTLFQFT